MTEKNKIVSFLLIFGLFFVDQLLKILAFIKIPSSGIFILQNGFLKLKLITQFNPNLAFGINISPWLAYFFLGIVFAYLFKKHFNETVSFLKKNILPLSMLLGGSLGNLMDRIFRGAVLDYIQLSFNAFTWPTFNFADIVIVSAGVYLIIRNFKE